MVVAPVTGGANLLRDILEADMWNMLLEVEILAIST
jgi:hypothetical protein